MSAETGLAAAVSFAVLLYLVYTLLRPERF